MKAKNLVRLPDSREQVRAEAREVLRDVSDRPHLFTRVRLTGWHFPHRALEPFVVIGDVVSRFVVLDRDGSGANAYFDELPPAAGQIGYGYGNVIHVDFPLPFEPEAVARLDRARLPRGTVLSPVAAGDLPSRRDETG